MRPIVRDAVCWFVSTNFPDYPCLKLSDDGGGRVGRNTNHLCLSPTTAFVKGVVCSLFPYLNFIENCCCFGLLSEILMPWTCNFNFPGKPSINSRPSGVCMTCGRERNPEKASTTSAVGGRFVGSLLQHLSRNSHTRSAILSEGR